MTATSNLRRSTRVRTATAKVRASAADTPRIEKRRSPRLTDLRNIWKSLDADTVQTRITTRIVTTTTTTTKTRIAKFIDDGASENSGSDGSGTSDEIEELTDDDMESDSEASCPSSPEPEEHVGLTGDWFEYMAADPLDRRESYDSRLEEGNEYLYDDFIVGDDYDDDVSTVGSEITIGNDVDEVSTATDSDGTMTPERKRRLVSKMSVRRSSKTSIASSSSGLFVTDDKELGSMAIAPPPEAVYKAVGIDVEPADVVEEITDALCRFSRRCNQLCPPLRLELTSNLLEDEEAADAMQRGIKQGLGKCIRIEDGRVLYTVGPPSK
jgi:hypothetical protein